jgi:transcriptional regulator with XRE-family HTH domain
MPPPILPPEVQAGRWAFGTRLRELRKEGGLTQEALAAAAGLDRKTISRTEGGVHSLLVDQVLRIALALRVRPRELFDWPPADDRA